MTRLRPFLSDERGTATIEFVLIIPVVMTIFMASFESSLFMARHVMLERSVDIVVRDIRLGKVDFLKTKSQLEQHNSLKQMICSTAALVNSVNECVKSMRIWLQPVSTADFEMKAPPRACVDKLAPPIAPLDPGPPDTELKLGDDNEIMLMRICLKERPMFPTTAVGAGLIADGEDDGAYALMTTTIFVNEPG